MATTDARPGFKLPWGSDRSESDSSDAAEAAPPGTNDEQPAAIVEHADDAPPPEPVVNDRPSTDPWRLTDAPAAVVEPAARRKPNKLMADLTRAMQTAAESARDETLTRLQSDAKSYIETVHTRSATEAEQLRHTADADIAGIREWSKTEIARIREETDQKVTDRKERLDREVEDHAARIEARIEQVQNHVASFETDMAGFFERLLGEEDPTQLASMAESLPEPPTFDDFDNLPEPPTPTRAAPTVEAEAVAEAVVADPSAEVTVEASFEAPVAEETEPAAEAYAAPADQPADDPEAVFAAIQAAAEAAAAAETPAETTADGGFGEAPAEEQPARATDEATGTDETDPRLAVLGLGPDGSAEGGWQADPDSSYEAEAAAPAEDIPAMSDDAVAARLAGLMPGEGEVNADLRTTRVVVHGLVSVASIAGFKRHIGKIEGVASVGVSSGPDGEFVFAVSHDSAIDLTQAIPALPGFAAQITSVTDDTVSVSARDPETES